MDSRGNDLAAAAATGGGGGCINATSSTVRPHFFLSSFPLLLFISPSVPPCCSCRWKGLKEDADEKHPPSPFFPPSLTFSSIATPVAMDGVGWQKGGRTRAGGGAGWWWC